MFTLSATVRPAQGDHAVGPFDFLHALPPQSFQLLPVHLAHSGEDVLDHRQLHRHLEQQPPHAVGALVHDALYRGGDDTGEIVLVLLAGDVAKVEKNGLLNEFTGAGAVIIL